MTRIQKERFASEKLYNEQKNVYILTPDKLTSAKPELKILHPLPRVDEIAMEVDNDPPSVDQRAAGVLGACQSGPLHRMAHGDDICVSADNGDGVHQIFTLGDRADRPE